MKKKLFTLSLLFSAFTIIPALAQSPVLTSSNSTPPLNTAILFQSAKTTNITFGSMGENQTWDYSQLVDTGSVDSLIYADPSSTPGAGLFPNANLASVESIAGQHAYNYAQISSNTLSSIGSLSPGDTERFIPPTKIITFPFSYGSSFTDSGMSYDYSSTGIDSAQIRTKARATGYGSLVLPGGHSYQDVLQVTDSFTLLASSLGISVTGITQTYYYAGFADLLTIEYSTVNGFGFTESNWDVIYIANTGFLGIADVPASQASLQVTPNPTEHFISITASNPGILDIFSISGKLVLTQRLHVGKNKIDVSQLPSGNYFGRTSQGHFRFIKE